MTDLEIFRALLGRASIPYAETAQAPEPDAEWLHDRAAIVITVPPEGLEDAPPQVRGGYTGFYSCWYFDAEGALLATGAWE